MIFLMTNFIILIVMLVFFSLYVNLSLKPLTSQII